MSAETLIAVAYKKGVVDPVAHALAHTLRHWSGPRPKRIETAQLYRLHGALSGSDRTRIARDLLCDPVIQAYTEDSADAAPAKGVLDVDIWYKSGVTDVAGSSVLKGIRDLSIQKATDVRTGMRYRFWGLSSIEAARKVAVAYLANPLVQDIIIHADR